jgi:hypothetical protein
MTTNTETLRAEPGIDVRRLKAGTQIIIETQSHVYEMKAVLPQSGLFEISSTDPPLHAPIVGKFTAGRCAPATDVEGWVGKGLQMVILFRNGYYVSEPLVSAEVKGNYWQYTVF